MKHSTMALIAAMLLWAAPAAADDAFSYDALRPDSRFQWNTIERGRDIQSSGPLGDTEGPGVRADPPPGQTGGLPRSESQIDCGPGARNLDMVTGERLRRLEPLACPGRF